VKAPLLSQEPSWPILKLYIPIASQTTPHSFRFVSLQRAHKLSSQTSRPKAAKACRATKQTISLPSPSPSPEEINQPHVTGTSLAHQHPKAHEKNSPTEMHNGKNKANSGPRLYRVPLRRYYGQSGASDAVFTGNRGRESHSLVV
jgi:hypothetical protein